MPRRQHCPSEGITQSQLHFHGQLTEGKGLNERQPGSPCARRAVRQIWRVQERRAFTNIKGAKIERRERQRDWQLLSLSASLTPFNRWVRTLSFRECGRYYYYLSGRYAGSVNETNSAWECLTLELFL